MLQSSGSPASPAQWLRLSRDGEPMLNGIVEKDGEGVVESERTSLSLAALIVGYSGRRGCMCVILCISFSLGGYIQVEGVA